jgi:hypothetical protein
VSLTVLEEIEPLERTLRIEEVNRSITLLDREELREHGELPLDSLRVRIESELVSMEFLIEL